MFSSLSGNADADVILPLSPHLNAHPGENVTLSCSYYKFTEDVLVMPWYRQYPGSKPELFLYIYLHGTFHGPDPELRGNLFGKIHQDLKQVDLVILDVPLTDSALYYCALMPTATEN